MKTQVVQTWIYSADENEREYLTRGLTLLREKIQDELLKVTTEEKRLQLKKKFNDVQELLARL